MLFKICKLWTPLSNKMEQYVMQSQCNTVALLSLVSFIPTTFQIAIHNAQQLVAVHR